MERPIGIDLFAGAGGLSLGFEQAGFDILAAVEVDPIHCATHEFNFPGCRIFCKSVADVAGQDLRAVPGIGNRDIAVVFGGAPCQGFSLIGKRLLDDPRNSLVREFVRLVKELQPRYFVFENVPGLTIGRHRQVLTEVIEAFASLGYAVRLPYEVLRAPEYGVPQDRRRLFLIGARCGEKLPEYPHATHQSGKPKTRDIFTLSLPATPSVWEAMGDLPDVENLPELLDRDSAKAAFGEPSEYAAILRGLRELDDDYGYKRLWDPSILTSSMRTTHTPVSIERFASTDPGTMEPVSRFLRLDPNGLCNTLRAGTGTERGAFTSPRPIHPYIPRCITVREAARLHSYPDWFRFHTTKWHGFRQVGNSVPPYLAKAVASSLAAAMQTDGVKPMTPITLGDEALLSYDMRSAARRYGRPIKELPRRIKTREALAV